MSNKYECNSIFVVIYIKWIQVSSMCAISRWIIIIIRCIERGSFWLAVYTEITLNCLPFVLIITMTLCLRLPKQLFGLF